MIGFGVIELVFLFVGLLFSLAPLGLAIWALVTASRLRSQVETLERRVAELEAR